MSVTEAYRAAVAAGRVVADPAQEALLPELDRIQAAVERAPEPQRGGLRGLFGRAPEPVRGLYLWGGVGRGKSMLMDLLHEAVAIEAKRRVHFHAFMQEVQAGLHAARRTGVNDAIRPVADEIAARSRLLCFDEMQIGDIADAMIVGRLFERLFAAGVVVVTTSNRPPEDLYRDGLNRSLFLPFIALLADRLEIRELVAVKDYRQDRLSGSQVYFHPADKTARAAIDRLWAEMAGGEGAPLVLSVKGRRVELPHFRAGVARASFWELCARPLGAADYLALAQAVRVLILEDVPRMGSENYNEARRFVTLVDALYEAKVRVVMSAADRPDALYIEGEGSFEFARTASRLAEMQADGWGG